jgi:hypothetical protein
MWKLAQVRLYSFYGKKWSYTYMYIMEVFDTLKEKNAVVMSMYHVTEYTT